jgi:hypothetical protein
LKERQEIEESKDAVCEGFWDAGSKSHDGKFAGSSIKNLLLVISALSPAALTSNQ